MLPLIFQTGNSISELKLPLDRPTVIQDKEYVLAEQAVAATNTVLYKILLIWVTLRIEIQVFVYIWWR